MAKGISNTSRTLEYIRSRGWEADVAERWIRNPKHPAGGFRKDLFGVIDIIALSEDRIIGVQSCGQSFAEHDRKILAELRALKWLKCNGVLMLIGWRKLKVTLANGKKGKAMRWSPRIKSYKVEDFI